MIKYECVKCKKDVSESYHWTGDMLCPTCMTQVIAFLNNHKKFNTNNKPRCCKTCKYNNLGLDVCTGCTAGNYEMWEAKDNG